MSNWKEEFDKEFNGFKFHTNEGNEKDAYDIKCFIEDLRKKDCEQLLKDLDEEQILNDYIEQGIKDYYNK